MANQPTEAVIAGSKGFALALLAPLTERVGTRPRIASDPAQAVQLTGGVGLVVVEFQGARSLEAIRQLRDRASGLAVIAAVPDGHVDAVDALRSLGVESARWDGKPDGVLSVVSRRLASQPAHSSPAPATAPATAAVPPPIAAATHVTAPPPPSATVDALFDDIALEEVPPGAPAPGLAAPLSVVDASTDAVWPANVPDAAAAADALAHGLQGVFAAPGHPLAVVAESMAGMSPLERAVLLGEPTAVDPEPIRRAAVMRVRVAAALATAPRSPDAPPPDAAAVSSLLAEIDGLLSEVNALVASAPAELQASLDQVRNALIKEAIDFSEALHQAAPAEVRGAPAPEASAVARRATQARLLTVSSGAEMEAERMEERRRRILAAVLGGVAVAAAAYHGYGWYNRRGPVPDRGALLGAPGGAIVVTPQGGAAVAMPTTVQSPDGKAFSAEDLKRLREQQSLLGNSVDEVAPGVVVVRPSRVVPPTPAR